MMQLLSVVKRGQIYGTVLFLKLFTFCWALNITPLPSSLRIHGLYKSYEQSLFRSLFNSAPLRAYTLNNVTLDVKQEFVLLVGRSDSGKSALFRSVCCLDGRDAKVEGDICINDRMSSSDGIGIGIGNGVKPILVDRKLTDKVKKDVTMRNFLIRSISSASPKNVELMLNDFAELLYLSKEDLEKKWFDLTPSSQFSITILHASLASVADCISSFDDADFRESHYPILLLDELFDFETSAIAGRVGVGVKNLVEHGGIVILATHKPQQIQSLANREIVLSGGKVLQDQHIGY